MESETYSVPLVAYVFLFEILSWPRSASFAPILTMSSTSHGVRAMCMSFIFQDVRWPSKQQSDVETGLHVFPKRIRRFIRHLKVAWPGEWADHARAQWGQTFVETYRSNSLRSWYDPEPRSLQNLAAIIPEMTLLSSVTFSCPFWPPKSILLALSSTDSNFSSLTLDEIPLSIKVPELPHSLPLEHLSFTTVYQSVRIGNGYHEPKYAVGTYFQPEWKRKYTQPDRWDHAHIVHTQFMMSHASMLDRLELSGSLCSFDELGEHDWPLLRTFIIIGKIPTRREHEPAQRTSDLVGVLERMPRLEDLRLLFSQTSANEFRITHSNHSSVLSALTTLVVSHICSLDGLEFPALRRLAVLAITHHPRVPIALGLPQLEDLAERLAKSGARLIRLRVMLEDKLTPHACRRISVCCPSLEDLEIEHCSYSDVESAFSQQAFAEALKPLTRLHSLRLCPQFPEIDAGSMPLFVTQRAFARYVAEEIPSLHNIGLEYRNRTGRAYDEWVDYEILRKDGNVVELEQLRPSFYPQTSIWHREFITA